VSAPHPPLTRRDWLLFLAVWLIAAGTLVARAYMGRGDAPLFLDTDDAMRMVVVRDFLGGQGWYDLVQHRLNTPYGAEIHWSRLVDLPLAGLLWLAGLFVAAPIALLVAGTVWPLLLMGVLLFLSMQVTRLLVGPQGVLPALVLPIVSPAVLAEFTPGRVDHHNVIIVLTLVCLWASLAALHHRRAAMLAGLAAATALAIAVESAPVLVAATLAFGLAYVFDKSRARALADFGLGLAVGLVLHLILARPPSRWLEAACDMISPVYVVAGILVGLAFLLVSALPAPRLAWQRFALLAGLGACAVLVIALAFPQCLGGPYAELDPWLQANWIGAITEARPWHASLIDLPAYATAVGVPVLLGVVVAVIAFRRDPDRRLGWLTLIVFLVSVALVMLTQVRGARLAVLPAVPAGAWLIVTARQAYLARPRLGPAMGLVGSWLAFSGVVLAVVVSLGVNLLSAARPLEVIETRLDKQACLASGAFADLRAMPPERIMTPIDLGSHMLLETPHEVVSAPYHRNEAGILDTFRFFSRPADEARAIAAERGLGLIVTCPAMPELQGVALTTSGTVLNLIAAGNPPDWLVDVSLDGPLKVYAILP
jgi:hypothetical protein